MSHLNIEIKAKTNEASSIKKYLAQKNARYQGLDKQKDIYFHSQRGRLKLRQGNIENSLIHYERSDQSGPKDSIVTFQKLPPDHCLKDILRKSNHIKTIVIKERHIYFIDNVKFHIDEVKGLGHFVEIEAIDIDGSYPREKLLAQCEFYLKELQIKEEDLLECSYSDLIMEKADKTLSEINEELFLFREKLLHELKKLSYPIDLYPIDHLCYRTETVSQYKNLQDQLYCLGDLLIESEINGRLISTFRLFKPLSVGPHSIYLLELPEPKESSPFKKGFEHVEFVIDKAFKDFALLFPYQFDWSSSEKKNNPELKLKLCEDINIKFHHQALDQIIENELKVLD